MILLTIIAMIILVFGLVLAFFLHFRDYPNTLRSYIVGTSTIVIVATVLLANYILLPLFLNHCGSRPSPSSGSPDCIGGKLIIDGSTAMLPLVTDVANDYMNRCSVAQISVGGGSSKQGLTDVESGTVQIADSDVSALSEEYPNLEDHQVAIVVFVLVVNKSVGITNLNTDQIQKIYDGTANDWSQLGHSAFGHITAISRRANSGTRDTFGHYVLMGSLEKGTTTPSDSTDSVISEMENTPGAIGYVSLYAAQEHSSKLTILTINGHPYSDYVNNGYTFWNIEHMYTNRGDSSDKLAQEFIAYMGNTDVVKQTITTDSFGDINDMPATVLESHC